MINGERERGEKSPGVKIYAEDPGAIFDFIKERMEFNSNPLAVDLDSDVAFPTGTLRLHDNFLETIQSGCILEIDEGMYENSIAFVVSNSGPEGKVELDRGALFFRATDFFSRNEEDSINVDNLEEYLAPLLKDRGLSTLPKDFGDHPELSGFRLERDEGNIARGEIKFHRHADPFHEAYCFHIKGEIPRSKEEFVNNFREFTELAELVANTIYESNGKDIPAVTLELKMNDAPVKELRGAKRRVSAFQSVAGDIISAGVEEDVEKMILVEKPDVTFEDIGGQEKLKEALGDLIDYLKFPDEYKAGGVRPMTGVIIEGPKGVGKTLLGKAVANEADATFFYVKLSDVIHGLVGRTPKLIAELFKQATLKQPAVIFIDEFDALAGSRDSHNDYMSQVTSALLVEMDGIVERGETVAVITATNRIDLIDDAMRRPKRFGLELKATKPSEKARGEIIDIVIRQALERSGKKKRELFGKLDKSRLIRAMQGYSGADIEEVIQRALLRKVRARRKGNDLGTVSTSDVASECANYERAVSNKSGFLGSYVGQ